MDDVEDEWVGKKFDYIHIRIISGAIKDWNSLLEKAFNHLNPGGYLECAEFEVWMRSYNDTITNAPDIDTWQVGLHKAANNIGRTMEVAANLEKWIKEAGFEDVVEEKTVIPSNPWPKDKEWKLIGAYQQLNMLDAASSWGQAHFTRVLGWSSEEYAVLNANVRTQLKDQSLQLYSLLYVFPSPSIARDFANGGGYHQVHGLWSQTKASRYNNLSKRSIGKSSIVFLNNIIDCRSIYFAVTPRVTIVPYKDLPPR
jgi:hypothetical protein